MIDPHAILEEVVRELTKPGVLTDAELFDVAMILTGRKLPDMALKRHTNYIIETPGTYPVKVTTFPDSKVVHLIQDQGSAQRDEHTERVTVTFDQLADLIGALEEIRLAHVPKPYSNQLDR